MIVKKPLSSLVSLKGGFAFKSSNYAPEGVRIVRIANVQDGYFSDEYPVFYSLEDAKGLEEYFLEEGALLMSLTGNVGRVALLPKEALPAALNQRVECLHTDNQLLKEYLYYFFRSNLFLNDAINNSSGIAQLNMSTRWLSDYLVPIPDKDTMISNVGTFKNISEIINKLHNAMMLLDEQVKSLFNEMFGQPGINEKGYLMVSLGDLAKSINYGTSKPAVKDGKTPYLRMGNMTDDGRIDLSDLKYITLDGNEYEKSVVRDGDFLFNRTNSREHVGRSVAFHEKQEMIIAGYIIRVRLDKTKIEVDYLSAFMNSLYMKKSLFDMAKGAVNQANINAKEMAAIKLFLPPLDLQIAFVEKKKQIDKLRFNYQRQIEVLQELLNKKMEEYFGGEES